MMTQYARGLRGNSPGLPPPRRIWTLPPGDDSIPYPPVEETAGERRPPRREAAAALVCRCICGPLPNPPPALRWRGEGGARWQCRDAPHTNGHISTLPPHLVGGAGHSVRAANAQDRAAPPDRKSTRLNSSHL